MLTRRYHPTARACIRRDQLARAAPAMWVVVLLALLAGILSGCADVAPGQDALIVNSERGTVIAFEAVDGFLKAEHDNRELVKAELPAVHAFAETLRREGPAAFAEARRLTALYKLTRAPADADAMTSRLNIVEGLAREARAALVKILAKKPRTP